MSPNGNVTNRNCIGLLYSFAQHRNDVISVLYYLLMVLIGGASVYVAIQVLKTSRANLDYLRDARAEESSERRKSFRPRGQVGGDCSRLHQAVLRNRNQ
jgi:hypothetical protein